VLAQRGEAPPQPIPKKSKSFCFFFQKEALFFFEKSTKKLLFVKGQGISGQRPSDVWKAPTSNIPARERPQ
jgi:hypothetical protein